jgi:hypothetical protein
MSGDQAGRNRWLGEPSLRALHLAVQVVTLEIADHAFTAANLVHVAGAVPQGVLLELFRAAVGQCHQQRLASAAALVACDLPARVGDGGEMPPITSVTWIG